MHLISIIMLLPLMESDSSSQLGVTVVGMVAGVELEETGTLTGVTAGEVAGGRLTSSGVVLVSRSFDKEL